MHDYQPPYTITPAIVNLIAQISEEVGRLTVLTEHSKQLRLRRINRVRTIHGSLAIEGNRLSEEQVTAILDGKKVIAPPREIQEVRNAIKAYDKFNSWSADNEKDLKEAHQLLMAGLIDEIGMYRHSGVGVVAGKKVIHVAPPADRVPALMQDLFKWLSKTDDHPLVASSVFHYEFEFIHPFADGNGRMGRLWQTLILKAWNPLFADIPIESLIFAHQEEYYEALQQSTDKADSAPFIEFILKMILNAILSAAPLKASPQDAPQVTPQVKALLEILDGNMGRDELQNMLGLKDRKSFRKLYLKPALDAGLVEMTIPDKPNSKNQKYRVTGKGKNVNRTVHQEFLCIQSN